MSCCACSAFTCIRSSVDTEVVAEPLFFQQKLFLTDSPDEFEHLIVARSVTAWHAADGSPPL